MRTARQAIKRWFRDHPKTLCPVVEQPVCRHNGCDNQTLRSDVRCNIALKMRMAEAARATDDDRPWIADLRITPDGRRFLLNFAFDRAFLQDFRSVIPASDRAYDAARREWSVERRHFGALDALFSNFAAWDCAYGRTRGRGAT
ncbi:MAG: hypothetical protein FJ033_09835 [Chloroflexi bacterium]|nr:hypothetical protein [Chloroflexota bacterium]